MYIVISNDKRTPPDLVGKKVTIMSMNTFYKKATADEGFTISKNGGIYYNVECLTPEIYESLRDYAQSGSFPVKYYRFSDQKDNSPLSMSDDITVYELPGKDSKNNKHKSVLEKIKEVENKDTPKKVEKPPVVKEVAKTEPVVNTAKTEVTTPKQETKKVVEPPKQENVEVDGLSLIEDEENTDLSSLNSGKLEQLFNAVSDTTNTKKSDEPGKVILFGSAKGGTGKTFTCLISAYHYAQKHPNQRIALADFDIADGQIDISIDQMLPTTMADFYKPYKDGEATFTQLEKCKVKCSSFSPNVDFYLAPPIEVVGLLEETEYWKTIFQLLIQNYDVVFFDSGPSTYLTLEQISTLYKIADKIIITSNMSSTSVRSVIRQLKVLGGQIKNKVFTPEDEVLDRVRIVLTRVYPESYEINKFVIGKFSTYAPVCAVFGNIDITVQNVQYLQMWDSITRNKVIVKYLDIITDFDDVGKK